jgi:hypothetical protein
MYIKELSEYESAQFRVSAAKDCTRFESSSTEGPKGKVDLVLN